MRLKLVVAYDGAAFRGWQSQPDGSGVQDCLESIVSTIAGYGISIYGAGRTDAGVHALGQVCHFDVDNTRLDPLEWARAINGHLPSALRVLSVRRVPKSFHARFSATAKIYRYRIACGKVQMPLEAGQTWHIPNAPSAEALRSAASLFQGNHDFAAFCAKRGSPPRSTRREIGEISVSRRGTNVALTFRGEGFLYKMVRMLAAAIVRVAMEKNSPEDIRGRLQTGAPSWTYVAPACGLTLVKVLYKKFY